ncbi:MAG: hypothetical protein QW594_03435 [Candidatus Woesearchaeota archaeon]
MVFFPILRRKKGSISTIVRIILLTFLLLIVAILFFGGSGWFAKLFAHVSSIIIDVEDTNAQLSSITNSKTNAFDRFLYDYESMVYSKDDLCIRQVSLPEDFEGYILELKAEQEGTTVTILDPKGKEVGGVGKILYKRSYPSTIPCIVYGEEIAKAMISNLEEKKRCVDAGQQPCQPTYRSPDAQEYLTTVLTADELSGTLLDGSTLETGYDHLMLYKSGRDHVCLVPSKGGFLFWKDTDLLDPDTAMKLQQSMVKCKPGTIPLVMPGPPALQGLTSFNERLVQALRANHQNGESLGSFVNGAVERPANCGDWLSRVYKWLGYAYQYTPVRYQTLQELALAYPPPIGYNDNRQKDGHALLLLGIGPDATWWLEQLPEIRLRRRAERKVYDNEALVISFGGAQNRYVTFEIYPATAPYLHGSIVHVHEWVPLCAAELKTDGVACRPPKTPGLAYWTNDASNCDWSRYWIPPNSPYYPKTKDACNHFEHLRG